MIRLSRFAANSIHRKSKISTTNFESSTKQHKKPTANINEVYAKIQQIKHDESVKNKRWGNEKSKVSDHGPTGFQLADKREGKTQGCRGSGPIPGPRSGPLFRPGLKFFSEKMAEIQFFQLQMVKNH